MKVLGFLRPLLESPLYVRVSLALWGALMIGFAGAVLRQLSPDDGWEWIAFAIFFAVAAAGGVLCYAAVRRGTVERAREFLLEGGDPVGVLLAASVALFAIPITMVLRAAGVPDE